MLNVRTGIGATSLLCLLIGFSGCDDASATSAVRLHYAGEYTPVGAPLPSKEMPGTMAVLVLHASGDFDYVARTVGAGIADVTLPQNVPIRGRWSVVPHQEVGSSHAILLEGSSATQSQRELFPIANVSGRVAFCQPVNSKRAAFLFLMRPQESMNITKGSEGD